MASISLMADSLALLCLDFIMIRSIARAMSSGLFVVGFSLALPLYLYDNYKEL